jgi:long-chain fatty acid transport protein
MSFKDNKILCVSTIATLGSGSFHRMKNICFMLVVLSLCLTPFPSHAAGIWLYEQAIPSMGLAAAGRAALAQDASTVSTNPAGMTLLKRSQLVGGLLGISVTKKFDTDSTTNTGGNGGDAGDFVPAGTFAYVHSVTPDLKLGMSFSSYFGLGLDYEDTWAGRYYVQEGGEVGGPP